MIRTLVLLASFGVAVPAAGQADPAVQRFLTRSGFPAQAFAVFTGSQADAYRLLGPPASDATFPDEVDGGPEFRVLSYPAAGIADLELTLCREPELQRLGLSDPRAFCAVALVYRTAPQAQMQRRVTDLRRALTAMTRDTFDAGDVRYFVFDGFTMSVEMRQGEASRTALVLKRHRPGAADAPASP